jgi:hypothetical protein
LSHTILLNWETLEQKTLLCVDRTVYKIAGNHLIILAAQMLPSAGSLPHLNNQLIVVDD